MLRFRPLRGRTVRAAAARGQRLQIMAKCRFVVRLSISRSQVSYYRLPKPISDRNGIPFRRLTYLHAWHGFAAVEEWSITSLFNCLTSWTALRSLHPDFSIILLGLLLRLKFEYSEDFWKQAEQLVFYVLFPAAALHTSISGSSLSLGESAGFLAAGIRGDADRRLRVLVYSLFGED